MKLTPISYNPFDNPARRVARAEGGRGDDYTTVLSPAETDDFAGWKLKYAPNDSGVDYDLQGAYKAGVLPDPQTGHFVDTFKKPNHPTFSTQSQYAKDRPDLAGTWEGETYIPPRKRRDEGGMTLQRTAPFPEAPEGYEFYSPSDEPAGGSSGVVPQNDILAQEGVSPGVTAGVGKMIQGVGDWIATPGTLMSGVEQVQPEIPGQWSEEDQYRQDLAQAARSQKEIEFGGQTAMNIIGATPFGITPSQATLATGAVRRPPLQPISKIAQKSKELFGTTPNISEAGWVLRDGSFLDLSGRHQDTLTYQRLGERNVPRKYGERDYMAGARNVDHGELAELYENYPGSLDRVEIMNKFMSDTGALRMQPGIGFEAIAQPTEQQIKRVVSEHNKIYRGEPLTADIADPATGDHIVSKTFQRPTSESVSRWPREQFSTLGSGTTDKRMGAAISAFNVEQTAKPFYSAVERAIAEAPQAKASPDQWAAMLRNKPGVKPEEMEWTGLNEWLKDQKGPVTKQQVLDHVRENQVQVQEVMKGEPKESDIEIEHHLENEIDKFREDTGGRYPTEEEINSMRDELRANSPSATKFSSYTLPGGERYREMLLTLPTKV